MPVPVCCYCGKPGDLRPYGPDAALVCPPCLQASPERMAAAFGEFNSQVRAAVDPNSPVEAVYIGPNGPEQRSIPVMDVLNITAALPYDGIVVATPDPDGLIPYGSWWEELKRAGCPVGGCLPTLKLEYAGGPPGERTSWRLTMSHDLWCPIAAACSNPDCPIHGGS